MTVVQIWVLLSVFFLCVMPFPLEDPYCALATAICVDGEGDLSGHFDTLQEAIDSVVDGSGIKTIYVGKDLNSTEEGFKWCMDNLDNFPHYNCSEQWEGLSIKIGRMENQDAGTANSPITITPHPDVDEIQMHCGAYRPGTYPLSDDTIVTIDGADYSAYMYFGTPYWKLSGNFRFSCSRSLSSVFTIGPGIGGKTTIEGVHLETDNDWRYGILIFENLTDADSIRDYGDVHIKEVTFMPNADSDFGVFIHLGPAIVGANDNPEQYFSSEDEYKIFITECRFLEMFDSYGVGAYEHGGVFGLKMYGNYFETMDEYAFYFESSVIRFHLENNTNGGVYIDGRVQLGYGLFQIMIFNNVITYRSYVYAHGDLPNSDTVVFRENKMKYVHTEHVAIDFLYNEFNEDSVDCIEVCNYPFWTQEIRIIGNKMFCEGTALDLYDCDGFWRATIEDNEIVSYNDYGLYFGYCDKVTVKNNKIEGDYGVYADYCDLHLEGNEIISREYETVYSQYGGIMMKDNYLEQNGEKSCDNVFYLYYPAGEDESFYFYNNVFNISDDTCTSDDMLYFEYTFSIYFDSNTVIGPGYGIYFYGDEDWFGSHYHFTNSYIHTYDYNIYTEDIGDLYVEGCTLISDDNNNIYIYEFQANTYVKNSSLISHNDYAIYNYDYWNAGVTVEDSFIQTESLLYVDDEMPNVIIRRNIIDCEYLDDYLLDLEESSLIFDDNYVYNIDAPNELIYIDNTDRHQGTEEILSFKNNVFEIQFLNNALMYVTVDQYMFDQGLVVSNNLFLFNESVKQEQPLIYFDGGTHDSAVDHFYFTNNIVIGDFHDIDSLFDLGGTNTHLCENECEIQYNYLSFMYNFTDVTDENISDKPPNIENNFLIEEGSVFDFTYGGEECFGMPAIPTCYRPTSEVSGKRWEGFTLDHDLSLMERPREEWVTIGPFEYECPIGWGGYQCSEQVAIPVIPGPPEPNITTVTIFEEESDPGVVAAIVLAALFLPAVVIVCIVGAVLVGVVFFLVYKKYKEGESESEPLLEDEKVSEMKDTKGEDSLDEFFTTSSGEEEEPKAQKKVEATKSEEGFKRRSFLEFKKD